MCQKFGDIRTLAEFSKAGPDKIFELGGIMAAKKIKAKKNPITGSYTMHLPKSALTGKFLSEKPEPAKIRIRSEKKKTA